jgi:hypothetical protein
MSWTPGNLLVENLRDCPQLRIFIEPLAEDSFNANALHVIE